MTPQSAFKEIFIQVVQARNLFKKPYYLVKKDTWTPVTSLNKRALNLL